LSIFSNCNVSETGFLSVIGYSKKKHSYCSGLVMICAPLGPLLL
jgi:hypothetical protein